MAESLDPLRIVVVLPDPPLPFGNAASRWFYVLVRGLADRGHRVTTLAVVRGAAAEAEARARFPADRYDLRLYREQPDGRRSLWRQWESFRRPYSYAYPPELRRDLAAELAKGFDVLHLEQLWGGYLGHDQAGRALVHLHYLYAIDHAAAAPGGLKDRVLRWRTRQVERSLVRRYPRISTLTPRLSDEVRRLSPASEVRTIPLAMDLDLYPFDPAPPPPRPPVVALIGSFNWAPSYSAGVRLLDRLWPAIRQRVPEARLQIVGRAARSAFGARPLGPEVTIAENVPEIIPYFLASDVLLYAPSRGSGMKVKVLEAIALGVPVVTTTEGIEGLPAVDGRHAGISDEDAGLIERTVQLLQDPSRRQQQRLEARRLLEAHCTPGPVLDALEAFHRQIASNPR